MAAVTSLSDIKAHGHYPVEGSLGYKLVRMTQTRRYSCHSTVGYSAHTSVGSDRRLRSYLFPRSKGTGVTVRGVKFPGDGRVQATYAIDGQDSHTLHERNYTKPFPSDNETHFQAQKWVTRVEMYVLQAPRAIVSPSRSVP